MRSSLPAVLSAVALAKAEARGAKAGLAGRGRFRLQARATASSRCLGLQYFLYGAHSDSSYAAMLVQSMARGCLFLPAMLVMCTPRSTIVSGISQLLYVGLASR